MLLPRYAFPITMDWLYPHALSQTLSPLSCFSGILVTTRRKVQMHLARSVFLARDVNYSPYTTAFTHLSRTIQWLYIQSLKYAAITRSKFRMFSSPPKDFHPFYSHPPRSDYQPSHLYCQLTQAKVVWEEGTSGEKMPPSDWPVDQSVRDFLDGWLMWKSPV